MKFFFHNSFLTSLLFGLISINSALAIITSIKLPQNVLRPGHIFTVTFFTNHSMIHNTQYYVLFGLQPGTAPITGGNIGQFVLTSPQSDLVEGGHSVTSGHGSFKVDVLLPAKFKTTTGKKEKFGMTVAVFQTTGAENEAGVESFHGIVTIAPH
ncbi:uncharacterized protein EI90DRAFT_3121116 [Cantharellus anzutake]|uniref:uncharacterized protein n=1 Tax=Cantharellus anzutake TaxID=1750568 RepID=UPI00190891DF|nr:uncharacterized protein EI90DRAFT_3121116 [Cantharellus anzutake]KAF8334676.1 hypothetical protein EI90DRAFT_3121116 [Cantharellus anzutake]